MRKAAAAIWFGASMLALVPSARAQDQAIPEEAAGDEASGSTELVVTARRRAESVQDVPQTINVVTAEQVEKLNLRTFQEIQSLVPGLTMTQTSSFSSQATVRGVAFVPEASGNNPSVEFYMNDAPISSGFLFQTTYDFGQFELQRGPQGTLRGRASPSGSIAVTTRRPDLGEVGAVVNGTVTDLHSRKLDGAFNIPIVQDMLAVRIAGALDYNRSNLVRSLKEISDPTNNEGPYRRTKSIRASVRFEPADWIAFNAMYQSLHAESHQFSPIVSDSLYSGAVATTPIIRPFDRLSFDDQGGYDRQDHDVFVGNIDIRFAGQRLSYVGSYNKQDFASLAPQDNGDFFSPPRVNLLPRTMTDLAGFEPVCATEALNSGIHPTTGSFFQCTHGTARRKSHELRLASEERIAGIFDYVVGALYDHNENPTRLTQETPIVNTGTGAISNVSRSAILRDGDSTEKSVFANVTANLGNFELSGGLRYIDYRSTSSLRQGSAANVPPTTTSSQADKINATVYLASAKYQITPDVMVYALTGSSWRPGPRVVGNFSIGAAGTGQTARELAFTNLPPERSTSYEIGAKTSFLDGRGRFNISGYYQKFRNYPFRGAGVFYVNYTRVGGVVTPDVRAFNFVSPVPVTVKGVEAEASFRITPHWNLGVNASYSDGMIKSGTIACVDLNNDGVPDTNAPQPTPAQLLAALPAGQVLAQCAGVSRRSLTTPRFSANIQTEFDLPLSSGMNAFVRGLGNIVGSTQNAPENTFDDVGAYGTLNLFAGLRDSRRNWEITLFAKNVLGERQVLSVGASRLATGYRSPASNTYASEYRSVAVNAPREFGITARVALGSR